MAQASASCKKHFGLTSGYMRLHSDCENVPPSRCTSIGSMDRKHLLHEASFACLSGPRNFLRSSPTSGSCILTESHSALRSPTRSQSNPSRLLGMPLVPEKLSTTSPQRQHLFSGRVEFPTGRPVRTPLRSPRPSTSHQQQMVPPASRRARKLKDALQKEAQQGRMLRQSMGNMRRQLQDRQRALKMAQDAVELSM